MTNHVHLVLEPPADVRQLSALMKRLAGRQTRYTNRLEGRSGTLWEGRFKSSPIQTNSYFLACCRYVELNPVRATMVSRPQDYRWSSYRSRIGMVKCDELDVHPCFTSLGSNDDEQRVNYCRFVEQLPEEREITLIRSAVQRGQLTGNIRFIDEVEAVIGRRILHRGPGQRGDSTK